MPPESEFKSGSSTTTTPLSRLEWLTLIHVGVLVIATTWAFGGQADFVRMPLAVWASLSVVITLAAAMSSEARRSGQLRPIKWLWPLIGFNALVLLACLNPSLREVTMDGEKLYAHVGAKPWSPSSALPAVAVEALWVFDVMWLSAFNLALVIQQRRALRGLLLVLVINALVLSVFGTVQKLSHATGLYFDAFPTRQPRFFASFVYHNHWGAFMILMLAACIGVIWHYARRMEMRDILHSPIFAGCVAIALMAASVPLSGSRSSTLIALVLLGIVSTHLVWRVLEKNRRRRGSPTLPLSLIGVGLVLVLGAAWFVGKDTILSRLETSQKQVAEMREIGGIGDRALLYRNTWRMAADKLWFGWGMSSYPHVFFRLYNTRDSKIDRLPVFYNDAHNDWLQSFAEHGLIGSTLLALCALAPLAAVWRRKSFGVTPAYLFIGCSLVLLYAWVEFPFGNLAVVLIWWVFFFLALQLVRLRPHEDSL